MPIFARVFGLMKRLRTFARNMISSRQQRQELAYKAASDALDLFNGGLAAYLSDTLGAPNTDSEYQALLRERQICMLVMLHVALDADARRFLIGGLIGHLLYPATEIRLRSGAFEIHRPPIRRTVDEN